MFLTFKLQMQAFASIYVALQFLYHEMTSYCFCHRYFGKIVSKLKTKVIQSILTLLLMILLCISVTYVTNCLVIDF